MRDDTLNVRVLFWTGWRGWRLNLKLCVDKALYDVLFIHIIFKNHYKQLLLLLKYLWHVNLGGRGGGEIGSTTFAVPNSKIICYR